MKYEFRGKTVKEAIVKGLKKLGLKNASDVSITILDEGSRGLFETSEAQRPAVVMMELKSSQEKAAEQQDIAIKNKITDKDVLEAQKTAKKFLSVLLKEKLKINFENINTGVITGRIYVNVVSKDKEVTPDEDTIFSIETILNEIINKKPGKPILKLHLDFNFAIRRGEEAIREQAIKIAREVASTGVARLFSDKPICFHYRRIIHDAVRKVNGVSSVSKLPSSVQMVSDTSYESGWGEKKIVEIFPKRKNN